MSFTLGGQLGCPRKLGSMVRKWVISPTYKWSMLQGGPLPVISGVISPINGLING